MAGRVGVVNLRFLANEHVPSALTDAVRRLDPAPDIVRVQDVGLRTASDPTLLDWAAQNGRVLLSEDRATITGLAADWLAAGLPFAGVVLFRRSVTVGRLAADLQIVAGVYTPDDMATLVVYLPL